MNRIFTRNTLFSLLGIFIFSLSFFTPFVHKAEAETQPALGVVFPPRDIYGDLDVYEEKGYLTSSFDIQKKESSDTWSTFDVKIKVNEAKLFHGSSTYGQWVDDGNTTGVLDSSDTYGTLNSVYDEDLLSSESDAALGKEGFVIEMTESVDQSLPTGAPYQKEYPAATVSLVRTGRIAYFKNPIRTNINTQVLIPQIINQPLLWYQIKVSDLKPSTKYVVRLSGIEDTGSSPQVAYSQSIVFYTTASSSVITGADGVIIDQNNATTYSDTTSNLSESKPAIISGLECGLGVWPFKGNFPDCIVQVMYYVIYIPSAWILAGTGYLFNAFSLLSISSYMYSNASFITEGWKTIRDLMNMFFIFALLYAAIRIIISKDSAGSIAPLIKNIIVTAILINFSLFIVKIGIDASNITARIFYNAIGVTVTSGNTDTITNQAVIGTPEVNISQGIVAGFGIQRVTSEAELNAINKSGHTTSVVAILLIFGIIINLVAAGVFFTVGVLFVGRIVGFYMAMLFAPLAFMSEIIPIFKKIPQMDKAAWQSNLLKDIILAPLFLFFIWIILGLAGTDFLAKIAPDKSDDWTKMLVMIALEGMVILSMLVAAKKLAESQASFFGAQVNAVLSKGLNFVTGAAVGVATGGAALAGQASLGRIGASVAESDKLKEMKNKGGIKGAFARLALGSGEKLSTNSFDFRKTMAMKGLEKGTGITVDETGSKFGRSGLELAGKTVTVAANPFTDKRVDFNMEGGYAGATERGKKYREDYANSTLVTGLEAEDRDKRAKAWSEQYEKDREAAEATAKAAGAVFSKEAFKTNYEAGVQTRYRDAKTGEAIVVGGRKKVLSTKEENNRRLNERGNVIEFGTDYADNKKTTLEEYEKYMEMQTKAKAAKTVTFLGSNGDFDIKKFNADYEKRGGKSAATLARSITDKGIFNEDKFKNEYMGKNDALYALSKGKAKASKNPKYIGADGEFNETWFRQEYVAKHLNDAQNQAVSGIRKKAGEEIKKDKELSKKESDRIKDSLAKSTKQFEKVQQSIDNAKRITGETDEEDAVESMARVLDKEIIKLDLAVDAAKKASDTKAQARAMYKKLQRQTQKKTYENALKNKRDAEQKINDSNTKLGE